MFIIINYKKLILFCIYLKLENAIIKNNLSNKINKFIVISEYISNFMGCESYYKKTTYI